MEQLSFNIQILPYILYSIECKCAQVHTIVYDPENGDHTVSKLVNPSQS